MTAPAVPAGYVALDPPPPGTATVVCRGDVADVVRDVLVRWGTLYAYAAGHQARRELRGRAAAYAVPFGTDAAGAARAVVVRHGWRGGALRRVRRDLFFPPTRAPVELATSERLRAAGVATPAVVAYAVYPAPAGLRRVDVATALVPNGVDLAAVLAGDATAAVDAAARDAAWVGPTAAL
ncbi:MAG TPA: lipopolysaccharide kinase InaA family protein, partial [Gemmatirosa sp.]